MHYTYVIFINICLRKIIRYECNVHTGTCGFHRCLLCVCPHRRRRSSCPLAHAEITNASLFIFTSRPREKNYTECRRPRHVHITRYRYKFCGIRRVQPRCPRCLRRRCRLHIDDRSRNLHVEGSPQHLESKIKGRYLYTCDLYIHNYYTGCIAYRL